MKTALIFIMSIIIYGGSARADQSSDCQLEIQKAYLKIPAVLVAGAAELEVRTQQSFWYGTYEIDLMVSGNLYAAFGSWAEGGMAFPVLFPDTTASSPGFDATAEKLKIKIANAMASKSRMQIDLGELKGTADAWGRCQLNGETIERILKTEAEAPHPAPVSSVGHDQSETLPEGQAAAGKVLPAGGDR